MSKILLLIHLLFLTLYGCVNTTRDVYTDSTVAIIDTNSTTNAEIQQPLITDTLMSLKGHCFLLENTIGNGQNQYQYRRLLSISDDGKKCSYKIFNSNTNLIRSDKELDVRTSGDLKIKKDTLYINWIGYYNSRWRHENNEYRKLNRVIEGKYAIEIIGNSIMLKFISEKIITEELDQESPSDNELPYNESLDNLYYKPIECLNAEKNYFKINFTPQKNKQDLELDKSSAKYNKEHSCYDQRSFDAGYDLARDQIGNGLIADADYLFKLTANQYNYYCFKKGVNQYLIDRKNY
jgi:hypothetical protein